jgi:hypothetical protein
MEIRWGISSMRRHCVDTGYIPRCGRACVVFNANGVEENKTIESHSSEIPREVIEIIIYDPP